MITIAKVPESHLGRGFSTLQVFITNVAKLIDKSKIVAYQGLAVEIFLNTRDDQETDRFVY
jgi:hypothetical protein